MNLFLVTLVYFLFITRFSGCSSLVICFFSAFLFYFVLFECEKFEFGAESEGFFGWRFEDLDLFWPFHFNHALDPRDESGRLLKRGYCCPRNPRLRLNPAIFRNSSVRLDNWPSRKAYQNMDRALSKSSWRLFSWNKILAADLFHFSWTLQTKIAIL
jgi:hypothetical protein